MRVTKTQLKQIIKEELRKFESESFPPWKRDLKSRGEFRWDDRKHTRGYDWQNWKLNQRVKLDYDFGFGSASLGDKGTIVWLPDDMNRLKQPPSVSVQWDNQSTIDNAVPVRYLQALQAI